MVTKTLSRRALLGVGVQWCLPLFEPIAISQISIPNFVWFVSELTLDWTKLFFLIGRYDASS